MQPKTKPSLLIVDDDKLTRETLASAFADSHQVLLAASGREALAMMTDRRVDIVLSDLIMPELDGMDMLRVINELDDRPEVIFVTGHATIESAVQAMKLGAYDYVTKPVHLERLTLMLDKAMEARRLRRENTRLPRSIQACRERTALAGQSVPMRRIVELALQVAGTDASVLIEGERGTGKELIANLIHENSPPPRADGPFIKVNCAAFAEGALESELFGHERGAFTGAVAARKGRFELADGGTLFLDEIGDLPASAQVKLLRFLQEHTFERVGGSKTQRVDERIVSATHRNLQEAVSQGIFREDLYYRLRVVRIVMPPLRERAEDIDALLDHYLRHFSHIHHRPIEGISPEVRSMLKAHPWPGNVRELVNCMESMVVMAKGPTRSSWRTSRITSCRASTRSRAKPRRRRCWPTWNARPSSRRCARRGETRCARPACWASDCAPYIARSRSGNCESGRLSGPDSWVSGLSPTYGTTCGPTHTYTPDHDPMPRWMRPLAVVGQASA